MEKNYKRYFVNNLREIREEKGLSQKTVAEKLGVPVSTYANWEQGRREPCVNDLFKIINVLDVDANELFKN